YHGKAAAPPASRTAGCGGQTRRYSSRTECPAAPIAGETTGPALAAAGRGSPGVTSLHPGASDGCPVDQTTRSSSRGGCRDIPFASAFLAAATLAAARLGRLADGRGPWFVAGLGTVWQPRAERLHSSRTERGLAAGSA